MQKQIRKNADTNCYKPTPRAGRISSLFCKFQKQTPPFYKSISLFSPVCKKILQFRNFALAFYKVLCYDNHRQGCQQSQRRCWRSFLFCCGKQPLAATPFTHRPRRGHSFLPSQVASALVFLLFFL
jgi:hypothetical protein